MIVKGAILFLRVVDFICDGYEFINGQVNKWASSAGEPSKAIAKPKPSYSIR
jgi:hypothetical protein